MLGWQRCSKIIPYVTSVSLNDGRKNNFLNFQQGKIPIGSTNLCHCMQFSLLKVYDRERGLNNKLIGLRIIIKLLPKEEPHNYYKFRDSGV